MASSEITIPVPRLMGFMLERARETYPEPPSQGHTEIIAKMAPLVAKHLPMRADLLDVGCGQGAALEWFEQDDCEALPIGITNNTEDFAACRAAGYTVFLEDMNAMPDWCCDFDCVWARHVLEHSIAPFFTLHEFARVLKPNGILYVEVPADGTDSHHESNQNHYSVMGYDMWLSLITRSGFEIMEARELNLNTAAGKDKYWSFICRKK